MKGISILGATGSVGTQALDVIKRKKEEFKLIGVSANNKWDKIINIINEFKPKYVAMNDNYAYKKVYNYCKDNNLSIEVFQGVEGLSKVACSEETDILLTSIVGMIGLKPTIEAIKNKKNIALANKETLVVGGDIVKHLAKENGVEILPVDSEHCAIFQCLQGNNKSEVDKIILTASGGPFRGRKIDELTRITAKEALKHPKWNMGPKISIDSATLMNKGLEVIEAHHLFDVDYSNIEVVIHPQSMVHSMVQYIDGSVIAQLGDTDMRLPIQYAINYPNRTQNIVNKLDFYTMGALTFEKPDMETFKPLKLAYESGIKGGLYPTILNGANEKAVELFLKDRISFLQIGDIIEECLNKFESKSDFTVDEIIELDFKVKRFVEKNIIS